MATTTTTGGWPDATNTGLPPGVTLTPSGGLVITQAGAVISGLNIQGAVYIDAPNVTLENCKITSTNSAIVQIALGVTGAVVQNCEINGVGTGNDGSYGILGSGTFVGNNIYNVENGIGVQNNNTVIKDNYIHDLKASGSPHYDGIEIDGSNSNITIEHNTVINDYNQTSAIMIDNYWGPISNISVNNNLLVGGGYTIYSDGHFTGGSISGLSITNNHIGTGMWGPTDFNSNSPTYTGNVNDGAALAATLNTPANSGGTPPSPTPSAPVIASYSQDSGVPGDGVTDHNTLTLTGTAVANSTVNVFDGATKIGTATANSSGAWTYTSAALADGKHSFTATDTSSGKTSTASSALSVTVDTHAPVAPVLVSDSVVNTNHVLLSGTAEANSTITVYDGTTAVGTATAGSNGAWSVTTGALATGSQVLTATATDAAGNTSAHSAALDPVIGSPTPPPTPTPSAPKIVSYSNDSGVAGDHITNDSTLTLTGTAVAGSTVTVFDGTTKLGTATVNSSGAWNYTTAALNDGSHSLTATDTSSGQTSSASSALAVTVDTHAPAAPTMSVFTQGGAAVGATTTVDDLLLKGTAEANSTVHVFDGGKQIGTATTNSSGLWSFDTGHIADGSHSFTSTDSDVAGNVSAASAAKGVTLNAPAAAAVGITNLSENSSDLVTIKGTADANSQIKIYDGTHSVGMVTTGADGTWSYTSSSAVSNTVHTYTAQELDSTGHVVAHSGSAILGSTGRNTLTSTSGNDVFLGNGHPDTFVFASNFGKDVINDFRAGGWGHDTVQFSKSVFDSFADVLSHATQSGNNVVIADHAGDTLTLKNVQLGALNGHDFHFA